MKTLVTSLLAAIALGAAILATPAPASAARVGYGWHGFPHPVYARAYVRPFYGGYYRGPAYYRPRFTYYNGWYGYSPYGWQGYYWNGGWYHHRRFAGGFYVYF